MSLEVNAGEPASDVIAISTPERLDAAALESLFHGEIAAIRISGFCNQSVPDRINSWVSQEARGEYFNDVVVNGEVHRIPFGVDLIKGVWPYNSTFGTPANSPERKRYRDAIEPAMARFREAIAPDRWLPEQLVDYLDALHPMGAQRAELEGTLALLGMIRVTRANDTILEDQPHIDRPPESLGQIQEFSANYYTAVPESGGELLVYKNGLEAAPTEIKPAVGELVMISTSLPHAVRAFNEGSRISIQTFIGYAAGKPLVLWN